MKPWISQSKLDRITEGLTPEDRHHVHVNVRIWEQPRPWPHIDRDRIAADYQRLAAPWPPAGAVWSPPRVESRTYRDGTTVFIDETHYWTAEHWRRLSSVFFSTPRKNGVSAFVASMAAAFAPTAEAFHQRVRDTLDRLAPPPPARETMTRVAVDYLDAGSDPWRFTPTAFERVYLDRVKRAAAVAAYVPPPPGVPVTVSSVTSGA